jgi:sialic acid synthase SpsE
MIIGNVDTSKEVFIIAEAGNNHEGDFQKAMDLVHAAAEAGASAIKFQSIIPEKLVSASEFKRIEQLKRFQLSIDQYSHLKEEADKKGLLFMSTPFAIESIDELDPLMPAFKISSGDLTWHDLIQKAASKGKPVFLSTGAANPQEIDAAVKAYHQGRGNHPIQLAILQCVMSYPAPFEALNLNIIPTFKEKYGTSGYSDHFMGTQSCLAAVALGAEIIEKHFTLDKNWSEFRDHQLSADPSELKKLVEDINLIKPMLGQSEKSVQACEKETKKACRRSPKAARGISQGQTISAQDIEMLRPNSGLEANSCYIGKKAQYDLNEGDDLILEQDS